MGLHPCLCTLCFTGTSKANSAYFLCNQMDSGLDCSHTGTAAASLETSVTAAQELDDIPVSSPAAGAQHQCGERHLKTVIAGEFFNKGVNFCARGSADTGRQSSTDISASASGWQLIVWLRMALTTSASATFQDGA